MAEELGLSTSYYEHLYKDLFGCSFHADLVNMRIEYAKDLLSNSNMTIEEIALASGYNSEVHFHRQFLKKTGMSPNAARKKPWRVTSPGFKN